MGKDELAKEITAVMRMTERRIDAVSGQLHDCELFGQKGRAHIFKAWLKYLYRTRYILRNAKENMKK